MNPLGHMVSEMSSTLMRRSLAARVAMPRKPPSIESRRLAVAIRERLQPRLKAKNTPFPAFKEARITESGFAFNPEPPPLQSRGDIHAPGSRRARWCILSVGQQPL